MASAAVGSYSAQRAPIGALLAANFISLSGSMLTTIAVPCFVLVTTGSAAKTGITGAVSVIPTIIAGVFGGTLVDRIGFRRVSIVSDGLSFATVALIPILFHSVGLAFWELLVLLSVSKLLGVPGDTGRRSLIPDLAGLAAMPLERANSLYSSARNTSALFGPLLAGLLIASFGASNVLLIDAGTFVVSALLIGVFVPNGRATPQHTGQNGSYLAELREGFAYLRGDRLILGVALAATGANFVGVALYGVILPVFVRHVYGSAVDLGIVLGADGIGALAGTLLYGLFAHRFPKRATFILAFLLCGAASMALATLPGLLVVVAILAVAGFVTGPLNPILQTTLQERVPQDVLGRVFGFVSALALSAAPIGVLLAGILLEVVGLRVTILLDAGSLCVVSVILLLMPSLRELD